MSNLTYRPDIDGLRAIAVTSVIVFHAGVQWTPGGFIGVDIFFVISGYLITRNILLEIDAGQFKLLKFYERRLRRIMPALIFMLIICIAVFQFIALPEQAVDVALSGLAALFSISNFWFWRESGYFAPATEFMPLLHTWSLSVEEQFYLLFPFFIIFLYRVKVSKKLLLFISTIVAFGAAVWLSTNKPSVAYYLLPTRAWELAVGASLAAGVVPKIQWQALRQLLAFIGLGLIFFGIFWIRSDMIFPGWVALIPCLGTGMLIHAGSQTWISRNILSVRPLVFFGLLSYSLYLWHWPIFSGLRIRAGSVFLDTETTLIATVATFVMALISWRFVELPFRNRLETSSVRLLNYTVTAAVLVLGIAVLSVFMSGFPGRLNEQARAALELSGNQDSLKEICRGAHDREDCHFGDPDSAVTIAIVGDSHAPTIRPAIEGTMKSSRVAGSLYWSKGCPLFSEIEINEDCDSFRTKVWNILEDNPRLTTVILFARWASWTTGVVPEQAFLRRRPLLLSDDQTMYPSIEENRFVFERSISRTVDRLRARGVKVIIVGAVPEPGFDVPSATAMALMTGEAVPSGVPRAEVEDRLEEVDTILASIAMDREGVDFISVWELFCKESWCDTAREGVPLYSDDDHLSLGGAALVLAPRFKNVRFEFP